MHAVRAHAGRARSGAGGERERPVLPDGESRRLSRHTQQEEGLGAGRRHRQTGAAHGGGLPGGALLNKSHIGVYHIGVYHIGVYHIG
eukprot:3783243-Pyramimonas_sp.AAC.1